MWYHKQIEKMALPPSIAKSYGSYSGKRLLQLLFFIGIGFLVLTCYHYYMEKQFYSNWPETTGKIIEVHKHQRGPRSNANTGLCDFKVTYSYKGTSMTTSQKMVDCRPISGTKIIEGNPIIVRVNPKNPAKARVLLSPLREFIPITLSFGTLFSLIGMFGFLPKRKHQSL